ncbi:hypothetical protein [Streptomyces sp. NPDC018711]|uniref:hypothetical protein n=1 Tax=Streptomyces sp. NPDC018711 TaxID=3365052 RepID=UPI0037AAA248
MAAPQHQHREHRPLLRRPELDPLPAQPGPDRPQQPHGQVPRRSLRLRRPPHGHLPSRPESPERAADQQ